jgi:hypothetical protein
MIVLKAANPWGSAWGNIPAIIFVYQTPDGPATAVCGNAAYASYYLAPDQFPAPPTQVTLYAQVRACCGRLQLPLACARCRAARAAANLQLPRRSARRVRVAGVACCTARVLCWGCDRSPPATRCHAVRTPTARPHQRNTVLQPDVRDAANALPVGL